MTATPTHKAKIATSNAVQIVTKKNALTCINVQVRAGESTGLQKEYIIMFEIGKRYEVPTVEGLFWGKWSLWPVMGPKHEDAAIIGFEPHHYHFDFRFFNPYQWTYVIQTGKEKYSQVLHEYTQTPLKPMQLRLRTCYRELPQYPTEGVPWLAKLNAAYAGHILGDDMICPHKGADLSTLPVVEGCITCPLHGLKWNLETRGLAAVVEIFA